MNSKRQGRGKLGHVVQIDVFQYSGVNAILNLSYVRWKSNFCDFIFKTRMQSLSAVEL